MVPVRPVNYNNPNQWLPTVALSNGTANFEIISDRDTEVLRKLSFSFTYLIIYFLLCLFSAPFCCVHILYASFVNRSYKPGIFTFLLERKLFFCAIFMLDNADNVVQK